MENQGTAGSGTTVPLRRLAAIFAADVVGYSRLVESDESGTLARLKSIRSEVIDPRIATGQGRVFNTAGDSILAEFASVTDALRSACEIQAMMAARNGSIAAAERIEYRIGVHQGEVVANGSDLLGDAVNIAARLEGIAEPGGICVSARVQEDSVGKLDVSFENIGEPDLKNISRAVTVYRVHPGRPSVDARSTRGLMALGPEIVCEGEVISFAPTEWELHVERFIIGDVNALITFSEQFDRLPLNDRYLLVGSLGDGRKLAGAVSFVRAGTGLKVKCPVLTKFPRINAQDLGSDLALSESGDIFARNGQIALVSGLEALPQRMRTCLSLLRGESPFHRDYGTRIAEYYHEYRAAPWLGAVLKLEVIRQAAIPYHDDVQNREYTPLDCIERVWSVDLIADEPKDNWMPMRFDVDVAGVGRRQYDIAVLIPEKLKVPQVSRYRTAGT